MENLFGKQGELIENKGTHIFYKNNPNIILPLKLESTSINRLYTTTFTSGNQNQPLVQDKGSVKLSQRYQQLLKDNEIDANVPEAKWTGNNFTIERVVCSTSRYGQPEFLFDGFNKDEMVSAMWDIYKPMLQKSRLTHPKKFMRSWKWGMNVGFGGINTKTSKFFKRRSLLQQKGRKFFVNMSNDLLKNLDKLAAIPHVFPKMEYLFGEKFKKIRSIIGAPFLTYFTQQIFAYEPDHRFMYHNTPMQVGRPLTGFGLLPSFQEYKECDYVFGLDMSAFDSTLNEQVIDCVAELRCLGYQDHEQFEEIEKLIKLSYKQNYSDPMFVGSLQELLEKIRGNATGCVSTSQTNSLALPIVLCCLYHQVSGKPYKQFFIDYKLRNYGDDNKLGLNKSKTIMELEEKKNTIYDMVKLCDQKYQGTLFLKIESEGSIYDVEFLSKSIFKLEENERKFLSQTFNKSFEDGIRHNKNKLIAKIDKFKKSKPSETDYMQKFAAYKLMCVHYPDLFKVVDQLFTEYVLANPKSMQNAHYKVASQDYWQIMKIFYSPLNKHVQKVLSSEFDGFDEVREEPVLITETIKNFLKLCYNNMTNLMVDLTMDVEHSLFMRQVLNYFNEDISNYVQQISEKSNMTPQETIKLLDRNNIPLMKSMNYKHEPSHSYFSYLDHFLTLIIFSYQNIPQKIQKNTQMFDFLSFYLNIINKFNSLFSLIQCFFFNNIRTYVKFDTTNNFYLLFLLFLIVLRKHFIFSHYQNYNFNIPILDIERYILNVYNNIKNFFLLEDIKTDKINTDKYETVLNELDLTKVNLFHAPTGWGKSTFFLLALQKKLNKRVVVIVPRAILTKSISKFLQEKSELQIGTWSYGSTCKNGDIIFTTPDSFLLRSKQNEFVIMDEAHIQEPQYKFIKQQKRPQMYFTATPTNDIPYEEKYSVKGGKKYEIEESIRFSTTIDSYCSSAYNTLINNAYKKALVFVPSVEKGALLAQRLHKKNYSTQLINSNNKEVSDKPQIYITTSVSDAGLTIPSVDLVISPDLDVHVTESKPYYFRLSSQTLVQRKGRTGRTCNGKFYLYKITSSPFHSNQHWHPIEEMLACSFASQNSCFANDFYNNYEDQVFEKFGKEILMMSDIQSSFVKDLTTEGIEPNPGPSLISILIQIILTFGPFLIKRYAHLHPFLTKLNTYYYYYQQWLLEKAIPFLKYQYPKIWLLCFSLYKFIDYFKWFTKKNRKWLAKFPFYEAVIYYFICFLIINILVGSLAIFYTWFFEGLKWLYVILSDIEDNYEDYKCVILNLKQVSYFKFANTSLIPQLQSKYGNNQECLLLITSLNVITIVNLDSFLGKILNFYAIRCLPYLHLVKVSEQKLL